MKINDEVLNILSRASITDRKLVIAERLDRKQYEAVNKVLVAAGGKWSRSDKGHMFSKPATEIIDNLIEYGEVVDPKKELQFFETPAEIAADLVVMAGVMPRDIVLEPSAGRGAIVRQIILAGARPVAFEIDPVNYHELMLAGHTIDATRADFLTITPSPVVDRVVMNPPFAKKADVRHVRHAMKFLKPGGVLVSVMGAGLLFRQEREIASLRDEILASGAGGYRGSITPLPEKSFRSSGTDVNTVVAKYFAA